MVKKILEKSQLGKLELKNKIVFPAITTNLATRQGEVTREMISFYENIAQAGPGLIITGMARVDRDQGWGLDRQIQLVNTDSQPGLRDLTQAVHRQGAKIFAQLNHKGAQADQGLEPDRKLLAPSDLRLEDPPVLAYELSQRNIQVLLNRFALGAKLAQDAGFDGVEIQAGQGHLIGQFLSPRTNRREDRYGGNYLNRLNFLVEVIQAIRQLVSPDFPLIVRMNGEDFIEGGLELEEARSMARIIAGLDIEALSLTFGSHRSRQHLVGGPDMGPGYYRPYIEKFKEGLDKPLIARDSIRSLAYGEELLREGACDFVAIGRGLIADFNLIHSQTVSPCDSCLACLEALRCQRPIVCPLNRELY